MSDVEEPPAKIAKTEMTAHSEDLEEMDEGQEEWLSEGLLTDDDNYQAAEQEGTESNLGNSSQEDLDETFLDETLLSGESRNVSQDSQGNDTQEPETSQEIPESKETVQEPVTEKTIEQTLNSLENQNAETTVKSETKTDVKQKTEEKPEKSDDNDTDDLLRLLGDNDDKSKKKVLVKTKDKNGRSLTVKDKDDEDSGSSDGDEYIFNSSSVQKLRVAKNAIIRKAAIKAEPEDMSEGDDETDCESLEESSTMKNIFAVKKPTNKASKSTTKPPYPSQTKKVVKIGSTNIEILSDKPTPKRPSILKSSTPSKPILKTVSRTSTPVKTLPRPPIKKEVKQKKAPPPPPPPEHDEIINEEEFLEEDDFDLDDDFTESLDMDQEIQQNRQMIMRPEQMDEEIPTDAESHTDSDASVYDELPSSDSEDMDDWFSLDIRAERASDFLPLLGDRAYELLTEEKRRVAERLKSLRHSVTQLHCSGQKQAEQLRKAAVTLAELDDMLKAA